MQDYNYLESNCMEITLELGCDKFPKAKELPKLWMDNIDSLFNFMFQVTHVKKLMNWAIKCKIDLADIN